MGWNDSSADKNGWLPPFDGSNRQRTSSSNGRSRSFFGRSLACESSFSSFDSYNNDDKGGFPRMPSLRRNKQEEVGISEQLSSFASIVMEEVQALMETNYYSSESDSDDESETDYASDSEFEMERSSRQRRDPQGRPSMARYRSPIWSRRKQNSGSNQEPTTTYTQDLKESKGLSRTRSPLWWRSKKARQEEEEAEQVINYSSLRPSNSLAFEVVLDSQEQQKPLSKKSSMTKMWRKMSFSWSRSTSDVQEEERQLTEERPSAVSRQFRWSFSGDEEDEIVSNCATIFPGDRSTGSISVSSVDDSERTTFLEDLEDSSRSLTSSMDELFSDLDGGSFFQWFKESEKNSAFHTMFPEIMHSMSDLSTDAEQSMSSNEHKYVKPKVEDPNAEFLVNLKMKEVEEKFVKLKEKGEEEEERVIDFDAQKASEQVAESSEILPEDMEDIDQIIGQLWEDVMDSEQDSSGPDKRAPKRSSSNIVFGESVRSLFQKSPSSGFVRRSQKPATTDAKPEATTAESWKRPPSSAFFASLSETTIEYQA